MARKNTEIKTQTAQTQPKLERANRIAVQNVVVGTGYKADFYRTHKKVGTMYSEDMGWQADETLNKTAQREAFRQYAIENAEAIGILWNPADLRSADNVRAPKYVTDEILQMDAQRMLVGDIDQLVAKCPYGVTMLNLEAEAIVPMTHTAKGADLSKMGITDGKYTSTGNWAWAEIEMLVTLTKDAETIYYMTKAQLVSGQLKKPHITQTAFNEAIKESLKEAGLWQEDAKVEDTAKEEPAAEVVVAEAEPVTDAKEEVQEEPKPKKIRKSSKKTDK